MKSKIAGAVVLLALTAALAGAQGTVSYKVDGKPFSFQDARLEYHAGDGYFSLDCERLETVRLPNGSQREVSTGMTIQLAGETESFVGRHEASSPDEMPVYFSWYEQVAGKDKNNPQIVQYLASLDSGDPARMKMLLKVESFGAPGKAVRGSFSGTLFDEQGVLHTISDGTFAVNRTDAAE
jgi:hypothetical protein